MIFRQLFDLTSCTYSYLLADETTQDALLIDSVDTQHERDLNLIQELGLNLKYCIDTHIHADHITGMGQLKPKTGCQLLMPYHAHIQGADRLLSDNDTLQLGQYVLSIIGTPGHTSEHICIKVNDWLFTGDTLLIRGCGRTDFQGGDAGRLYQIIHNKIFTLPDETKVFPGHDYKGHQMSTIGEEKQFNQRLNIGTEADFIALMANLNLPHPKKLKESVPANLKCGL